MGEIQYGNEVVIGNKEMREDMLCKLKKEFDSIHTVISENQMPPEELKVLIDGQISLCKQIVAEGRALGGENGYLFQPHAFGH